MFSKYRLDSFRQFQRPNFREIRSVPRVTVKSAVTREMSEILVVVVLGM